MPTVPFSRERRPTYSRPIGGFRYKNTRYDPGAFGAYQAQAASSVSQALEAVSNTVLNIDREEKEIALKGMAVDFSNRIRGLTYGDPDSEETGYLSLNGGDAGSEAHKEYRKRVVEARDELLAGASGTVADRFKILANDRMGEAFTLAARHANREREVLHNEIDQAMIANATLGAVNNPDSIGGNLAEIRARTESNLLRQGMNDPVIMEARVREQQSGAVKAVVTSLISQENPEKAASLFREYADFLTPGDRTSIGVALLNSGRAKRVQTTHDMLRAQGLKGKEAIDAAIKLGIAGKDRELLIDMIDADTSRERRDTLFGQGQADRIDRKSDKARADKVIKDATAIARELDPGPEQDALLDQYAEFGDEAKFDAKYYTLLRDEVTRQERIEAVQTQQQQNEAVEAFSTAIAGGASFADVELQAPGYAEIINKEPGLRGKLQTMARNEAHGRTFAQVSDGETFHLFQQQSAEKLLETNLLVERHKLTENEFNKASSLQAMARHRKGGTHNAMYNKGRETLGRFVDKSYAYDRPRKQSKADRLYNHNVTQELDRRMHEHLDRTGEEPTIPEIEEMVYRLTQEVTTDDGGVFGSGVFSEEDFDFLSIKSLTPEQILNEDAKLRYDVIPEGLKDQIIQEAANRGLRYVDEPPPEAAIEIAAGMVLIYDSGNRNTAIAMKRFREVLGIE